MSDKSLTKSKQRSLSRGGAEIHWPTIMVCVTLRVYLDSQLKSGSLHADRKLTAGDYSASVTFWRDRRYNCKNGLNAYSMCAAALRKARAFYFTPPVLSCTLIHLVYAGPNRSRHFLQVRPRAAATSMRLAREAVPSERKPSPCCCKMLQDAANTSFHFNEMKDASASVGVRP